MKYPWRCALLAAASLGLTDCLCEETYLCGDPISVCVSTTEALVAERVLDFESGCANERCDAQTVSGVVEVGASFHPGDHALVLSAFAVVEIPVSVDGTADGASLAVNARCDEGSSLRFEGNGVVSLAGGESLVSDSPVWRRRTFELSRATQVLQSLSEAQRGVTRATLRFSMRGPGRCQLDRLSYRVSAMVCTAHESVRQQCCRLSTAETTPAGDGGVTGR